jgi:hypothetical protein
MKRRIAIAGAAGLFALALAPMSADAAGSGDATVSVLHAVPGLTVDVYANGDELIPNFKPGTLSDPLEVPAGTYDLQVFKDGDDPDSAKPAIEAKGVQVPAGANATVVAHLKEDGSPTLTPFVNDASAVPAGQARVTVRHVAAAPAVDVRAGGTVVVPGLTNPKEASLTVPAGTVSADVVLAGTSTVAIGPADLTLAEGTTNTVYAWGSQDAGYKLAVQTISGGHSAPSGVPGGTAGLADESSLPLPVAALSLAGLVAAGVGALRLARTRG